MEKLEFGLFTHIERTSGSRDHHRLYAEHLEFTSEAEGAGFWGFHVAEHHQTPLSTVPSPNLFLAAAAQRTRRIRLGPMVYCLPFYNPLRLLDEICMLDNLSAGRLEVGVGRGISPFEHAYWGNPMLETRDMFEEALEVIVKGLVSERLSHHGRFYNFTDVPLDYVRPMQRPYPPFWYGCGSEGAAIYAGRRGMNICTLGSAGRARELIAAYSETRAKCATTPDNLNHFIASPKIGVLRQIVVADNEKQAEEIGRRAHKVYHHNIQKLWNDWSVFDMRVGADFEASRKAGTVIAGSAAQVHDALASDLDQVPAANYLVLNMKWGDLSAAESLKSLELFGARIMPSLERDR